MINIFMNEALKEAYDGIENGDGGPFGSVIVKNNKIIGRGHNLVLLKQDCTCHGEIMAIKDACKNLKSFNLSETQLYTTSEPCPMCLGAILWAQIDKVYYGCSKDDCEKIGFKDKFFYDKLNISIKNLDIKQIDKEECLKLFHQYSQIKGHQIY